MQEVRDQIRRLVARQQSGHRLPAIMIVGETGTGKGLVAHLLHRSGARARGPFVDVNCAAIPETLIEAELFGWERGAFTDARQAKAGLFQTAHGGTIFLDEIGLLPFPLQSKLLKVLEDQQVRRLGGTRSETVDVWVIAATSEDLDEAHPRSAVSRGPVSPAGGPDASSTSAARARRRCRPAGRALSRARLRRLRPGRARP